MTHLSPGSGPLLCFFLLLVLVIMPSAVASDREIDATGTVVRIVDGDTFDADPVGRVRLADIDTPEVGEPGAPEATAYLASLVYRRLIYLDVDDLHGTDVYGRIVAVVYVRHNAMHLLNVNKAMLASGLADMADFPNEFDPTTWKLYIQHPAEPRLIVQDSAGICLGSTTISLILLLAVLLVWRRYRGRRGPGDSS